MIKDIIIFSAETYYFSNFRIMRQNFKSSKLCEHKNYRFELQLKIDFNVNLLVQCTQGFTLMFLRVFTKNMILPKSQSTKERMISTYYPIIWNLLRNLSLRRNEQYPSFIQLFGIYYVISAYVGTNDIQVLSNYMELTT